VYALPINNIYGVTNVTPVIISPARDVEQLSAFTDDLDIRETLFA